MILKKEKIALALAANGKTAHGLKSVCEQVAYKAKNGKSISAKSAKAIADELGVDVLDLVELER